MRINDTNSGQFATKIVSCNDKLSVTDGPLVSCELVDHLAEYTRDAEAEIVCFLSEYDDLDPLCVSAVWEVFTKYEEFGAVICDQIMVNKQGFKTRAYSPSGDLAWIFRHGILLNIPFFCRAHLAPRFSRENNTLQLYEGLRQLFQQTLIYHCPQPLIITQHRELDYQNDLNNIKHG